MPTQLAIITPSVVRWARESAGYDLPSAAAKIGRSQGEIEAWEDGSGRPTLAQARKAAEVYRVSLAVLYLSERPEGYAPLRDFRHLPEHAPAEFSPELAWIVRQVRYRQEWLREYVVLQDGDPIPFVGSAKGKTDAREVAVSIRGELRVAPEEQLACPSRFAALSLWIRKVEEAGISVCRQGTVEREEARGFALTDPYAPFVFVNSADAIAGQLFTLVHELAHLWLDEPGISNLEGTDGPVATALDATEVLCNRIAAETLIETGLFKESWASQPRGNGIADRVRALSATFRVSKESVARKLLDLGIIRVETYRELRQSYRQRWHDLSEERGGGGNYYRTEIARNSRLFTQTVMSACQGAIITIGEASGLLGVKANNLRKLAGYLGTGAA